jgi:hypothetical protein
MRFLTTLATAAVLASANDEDTGFTAPEVSAASFSDTFADGLTWTVSTNEKYTGKLEVGTSANGIVREGEQSLIAREDAKHYAISKRIASPVKMGDGDFVVQYEVRHNKRLECGGAYIKLLDTRAEVQATGEEFTESSFDNDTPYVIMFGPDKCGMNDKVHFIIRHRNPVTGEVSEHHLAEPPRIKNDQRTHLYSLVIRSDQSFDLYIDQSIAVSGSLLENMVPPINPPQEIDDPDDVKPDTWVDLPLMDDPGVSKPDDWDEDAPQFIVDSEATMPEGWAEDGEPYIPDPTASQPEDWEEEDDGEWEAPLIENPVCVEVGCGPWSPPMLQNPEYKGPWIPPQIENPDYIGEWKPAQIANPGYFEDHTPLASLQDIGAVGIEIWTMQGDVEFDNFYIGTGSAAVEEASSFAQQTWIPKFATEASADSGDGAMTAMIDWVSENAVAVAVAFCALFFMIVCLCTCCCGDESEPPTVGNAAERQPDPAVTETAKDKEEDDDDEDDATDTTGPRKRR